MPSIDPAIFHVAGRTESLGAGETVWAQLWNGQGAGHSLRVHYVGFACSSNVAAVGAMLQRSTARGTVTGSVVTPDADNHTGRRWAPSGVTLDMGFTAQPTLATPELMRLTSGIDRTGSGVFAYLYGSDDGGVDVWTPIVVPDGEGLCVAAVVSSSVALDIAFGFSVG